MAGMMEIQLIGLAAMEKELGSLTVAIATLDIPNVVGPKVMDKLVEFEKRVTPVATGALQSQEGWTETDSSPQQFKADFFSTAVNEKSGYPYMQARAYGFHMMNGEMWNPPEEPPFPFQGAENSRLYLGVEAAKAVKEEILKLSVIPH